MEDKRALSRRLYRVLEEVGGSEELRQLHRETATVMEIADTVASPLNTGVLCNTYHCGSSFEGTVTPDLASDRDIISCNSYLPVVHDVRAAPPGVSFLVVRDSYTYPGYVKLQVVLNGQPLTARHGLLLQFINSELCELDSEGRECLKHLALSNMKGPARMVVRENGEHFLDIVPAFRCDSIPPFANKWFQKQRPNGQPSQEQVQAMSRMGCMFVGAGHVNSREKDIEWRLSFSLQERLLMSNLNPMQHKVYLLLKLIKKNILAPYFNEETLTSYHFKTCVLFTVQITPARAWTGDNLISCVLQCLKLMAKWLERGHCPNYFVHDQNLFVKAGFSRSLIRHLLHVIRRIVERNTQFVSLLQSDNICKIMRYGDCRRYRELSVLKTNDFTADLKLQCDKQIIFYTLRVLRAHDQDPVSLASTLNILQRTESINHHTTEVTQSSLAYLYSWLHLQIAKGLVSLTYRYPDAGNHQQLMEMADFHFNEARDADLVNERLARATVMFKAGQLENCFLLLQQVENEFIRHITLICPCTATYSQLANGERDRHIRYRMLAEMSLRHVISSMTASCVVFLPSELEITPAPLQHEMKRSHGTLPGSRFEVFQYWFDWAVVDPRVYLYFMQYLVCSRLNKEPHRQVALDNLRAEIGGDDLYVQRIRIGHLRHKDTAYNLLGWIYAQEGRPADAWRCFSESWKIWPCHNAAKFHMHDLCKLVKDVLLKTLTTFVIWHGVEHERRG